MTPKKEHPFLRTNLFSKDFILNHLNDLPEYTSLDDNLLKSKWKEVKTLYNEGLRELKESQLENNFLQPIFRLLDHIYEVQTSSFLLRGPH